MSNKRDKKQRKSLSGWDKAIVDAQKGIERLKLAIETCREKKAAGEPWPGAGDALMDLDRTREGWREAAAKVQERIVDVTIRYTANDQEYVQHARLHADEVKRMFSKLPPRPPLR